ncbi:MAG: hypothetical protein ACTSRS_09270 [Candidatus Helarchaeota archaeon]
MFKIGFLCFKSDLYSQLLELARKVGIIQMEIEMAIKGTTQYLNTLLNLPFTSEEYEIQVIDYPEFEELYKSIHHEYSIDQLPLYRVTGAINLKDPEVPGYVPFSFPRAFLKSPNSSFSCRDLFIYAAQERFNRLLYKASVLARVFEYARDDYHARYTLNKQKNVEAFLLYRLNKELIPIHETILFALAILIQSYLETSFPFLSDIKLPLIDREFSADEIKATQKYIEIQFKYAKIDNPTGSVASRRLLTGFIILDKVNATFPLLCEKFIENYHRKKAQYSNTPLSLNQLIPETIEETLKEVGLADLKKQFDAEYTRLWEEGLGFST